MNDEKGFYMIYGDNKQAPVFKHATKVEAVAEAERLCKANPLTRFWILKAVGHVAHQPQPIVYTEIGDD